jgi:hypothetical protein
MRRSFSGSGINKIRKIKTGGKPRLWYMLYILVLVISGMPVLGQVAELKATVDTASIKLGQQVLLNLNFAAPKDAKVMWPKLQDSLGSHIQIVHKSAIDTTLTESLRTFHQKITITSFDSGNYTIPPITVAYKLGKDTAIQFALSQAIAFNVQTLQVDTTRAIKDIKGPMEAPLTFAEILPWLLTFLALAIVVTLLVFYLRKRKKNQPFISLPRKPKTPPFQIALESLGALKSKKLWQGGRMKEYHSELTDIIRLYIENQLGIAAVEMTTDDILDTFGENQNNSPVFQRLSQLLRTADLAKFAKAEPLPAENELSMDNAVCFVQETMPLPPTVVQAQEEAGNQNNKV